MVFLRSVRISMSPPEPRSKQKALTRRDLAVLAEQIVWDLPAGTVFASPPNE